MASLAEGLSSVLRLLPVMHDAGLTTSRTLLLGTRQDVSADWRCGSSSWAGAGNGAMNFRLSLGCSHGWMRENERSCSAWSRVCHDATQSSSEPSTTRNSRQA